jgi:hypothetical protein
MRGIERARELYETKGRQLIHDNFPDYEGKIAVGLAGHGSECFGFDDELSEDHDFEVGFCLWLDDETDRAIGLELNRLYRTIRQGSSERSALAEQSRGVRRISDFYCRYTGCDGAPDSWQAWLYLPSHALAEAGNGQVWRDDSGDFTAIRNEILNGMPEDVRRKRLAAKLITMAQSGQYNYARCIKHGQNGSAMLAMTEFVNAASAAIFLLNRRHMPYYKWQFRAMEDLPLLSGMKDALEFLLTGENDSTGQQLKSQVVEDICAQVVQQLRAQGLTCGNWDYLEPHALDMMEHIQNPQIRALHVMEE